MDRAIKEIYDQVKLIAEDVAVKRTARERWGTAQAASADGHVEVLIDGGEAATPCQTVSTVHAGDRVLLTIDPFTRTTIVKGNYSKPAATDADLMVVKNVADAADELLDGVSAAAASADKTLAEIIADSVTANDLVGEIETYVGYAEGYTQTLADRVEEVDEEAKAAEQAISAEIARVEEATADALEDIGESVEEAAAAAAEADRKAVAAGQAASNAQDSANQANTYALGALAGLSTLESVIDTVNWFADHKTATTDTVVDDDKTYYEYDSATGTLTAVTPDGTENPSQEGWYELDETIQNYVVSHVAETADGLYVLHLTNGWRVLVSSGGGNYAAGVHIIDPNGIVQQSTTASGVDFNSSKSWHVGSNDAYILYTPASENTQASITIGGSNVRLGDSRTLSELMQVVDGTLIYDHDYEMAISDGTVQGETQGEKVAVFTAHLYRGGVDVAGTTDYPASQFTWYRKSETPIDQQGNTTEYLGNGLTLRVRIAEMGYGSHIIGKYTALEEAGLLTEDDEPLTTSEDEQLIARTAVGDSVRVSDLSVATVVYDTEKLMVVGAEDEHLVSIETLKGVFGTPSYTNITDKPSIEGVTLAGDRSFPELGIFQVDNQGYDVPDDYTLSTMDINTLWANAQPIGG